MIEEKIKEEWKDVEGYPNYSVSNLGRVYNKKRKRMKKCSVNNWGYVKITLYNGGEHKLFNLHRLVAQAFIPNPENKPQVNHLDENKLNNVYTNLSWATAKENANWGTRVDRISEGNRKGVVIGTNVKDGTKVRFNSAADAMRAGFKTINMCLCGMQKTSFGHTWERVPKN